LISKIETQEDVRGLLSIFIETWGAETLSEFVVSMQETNCLLAKNEVTGVVAGYLFYALDARGFIEITDVGVAELFRGNGYGREMVDHICGLADCVRLSVKESNRVARKLYESVGFQVLHVTQNYYGVGADGLRMEWQLNG